MNKDTGENMRVMDKEVVAPKNSTIEGTIAKRTILISFLDPELFAFFSREKLRVKLCEGEDTLQI